MFFHQAMATIDRHLAGAAGLTAAKKAQYRAAAAEVIKAMGPKALERWNANVKSITFHPDTESITRFARSLGSDLEHTKAYRGLCIRDPFQPCLCHLHLNGGADTGDQFPRITRDGFAHEFAHVIDRSREEPTPLSATRAWNEAWRDEKEVVAVRLSTIDRGANEGFADFAIFAWNYPDDARRHCPKCWRFWEDQELAGGGVG
jgi:hypothetical protein